MKKYAYWKSVRLGLSAVTLAVALALPTGAEETATADDTYVWDLSDIYATPEAWEAERQRLLEKVPTLANYKGTLGKSAAALLEAQDDISTTYKEVGRLYTYAFLKGDENLGDAKGQENRGLATALLSQFGQVTSYVAPEILEVGEKKIERFIRKEPGLAKHAFGLRDTLRRAPHTLGKEAEQVIAATADMQSGIGRIYSVFANSEVPWPTVTLSTGEEVTVNQANYAKYRTVQSREDRKEIFDAFWGTWNTYENTFGQNLNTHVKAHIFNAKTRKYESALASALAGDNIPVKVYKTLVEVTNESLPALHRYFKLRQRMLGLDDIHYYDIYPDLVDLDRSYTVDEAIDLTLATSKMLGDDYVALIAQGIDSRWMHLFPQQGKRSGAYMMGFAYDVHPYLLLNFNGGYDDVSTFAHEWGHAVHSLLSKQNQPWETYSYATFTAEIASITKELLLQEQNLARAETDDEKLFYLGYALEQMRGTFFRQTMFAEFELAIHEAVENGEALSGEKMTEMYKGLLEKYHGHGEGVMTIDPAYAIEWAYIPHFYRNFYVFQYATSMAGGALFADKISKGEAGAQDNYLDVLRAGGSEYPYEILKAAGIDMATRAPYEALVERMNGIMDQIEAILDAREEVQTSSR